MQLWFVFLIHKLRQISTLSPREERQQKLLKCQVFGCEQPGWLNNDIVDDAASDKEVGEEDECKDGPGGGGLNVITRCFKTYQTQYTY